MTASLKATEQLLRETPINPRTGLVWKLTDAEVAPSVAAQLKALDDPKIALAYLKAKGFVDSKGKLSKKYGG